MTTTTSLASASPSTRLVAALAALVFGLGLFLATGFAWPSAIQTRS